MARFLYKKTSQIIETEDKDKIKSMEQNKKYTVVKDKTEEFIDKNYGEQFTQLKNMIKNVQKDIIDSNKEISYLKKEVAQLKKK